MSTDEFVKKWLGAPWVDRGTSIDGVDCWGLVVSYYDEVLNIKLRHPSEYFNIETGFESQINSNKWIETESHDPGIVFTCFYGDTPTHVGVCLGGGRVIHCYGSDDVPGSVSINTIRSLKRLTGDKMKFYKYEG